MSTSPETSGIVSDEDAERILAEIAAGETLEKLADAGKCKTCRFLKEDERPEYKHHGSCRRMPPQLIAYGLPSGDVSVEQHWPWMNPDDWCGLWERAVLELVPNPAP